MLKVSPASAVVKSGLCPGKTSALQSALEPTSAEFLTSWFTKCGERSGINERGGEFCNNANVRFRWKYGDKTCCLLCACVDIFPDCVLPAAAGGWTPECLLQETRGIVLWGREDRIHHEGLAAAPEVLEGPASESRVSDSGLEWPLLVWRLEKEHLPEKKSNFCCHSRWKAPMHKVHSESTYWCCRYHDNRPWQQGWEDHL